MAALYQWYLTTAGETYVARVPDTTDKMLGHAGPIPIGINFAPPSPSVPDNAPSGTLVATATVVTSDGSAFAGTLSLTTSAGGKLALSGTRIVLARALTRVDDGKFTATLTAKDRGVSISANLTGTIVAPAPVPTAITFTPSAPRLVDNAPQGTLVASMAVAMSDGSTFNGSYAFGAPYNNANGLVAISGNTLLLARALTSADDGTFNVTVTATTPAGLAITDHLIGAPQ